MNRPLSVLFVLASALLGSACTVKGSDSTPCDPNPCSQSNRGICVAEAGEARCLCDVGFIPRPSGVCEPVSAANCSEHAGDAAEPDDCQARARPLPENGPTVRQTIEPIGDYDFFQFSATADELYSLSVTAEGSLMPRVDVFDQGGEWLTAAEAPGRAELVFKAQVTSTHFARISHSPVDPSVATGGYSLSFKSLGEDDHVDFAEGATSLSPDPTSTATPRSIFGRFEHPGDRDWFTFSGTQGRTYRVLFDPDLTVPSMAVFSGSNLQQPLLTFQSNTATFTLPTSGTFFIATAPPQNSAGSYAFNFLVD
jgi:hypothetical protein